MAGKLTTNEVILGDSSTPQNNFLLKTNQNGTATLARGSDGTLGNILSVNTNNSISGNFGLNSFKNKLINAQGLINQRVYVSGTATTTANQYTLDRWRVVTSGQNLTFSTAQNVTTFTAPAGGVEQVIEGLNIETGTYVLNWTGTATARINGTVIVKGGTISLTGGSNATVRFTSGTFSLPQLERAILPTSFDYRDITSELLRCQRYYATCYAYQNTYITNLGSAGISVSLPVRMRTTPTIAILSDISGNLTTPTFTSAGTTDTQASIVVIYAYGVAIGQAALSVSFSATAEL